MELKFYSTGWQHKCFQIYTVFVTLSQYISYFNIKWTFISYIYLSIFHNNPERHNPPAYCVQLTLLKVVTVGPNLNLKGFNDHYISGLIIV